MRKSIKFHKHRAGSVASPRTQQGTGARPARGSPARGPREGWLFYIGPAAGKPLADACPCVNVCKRRAGAPGSARTTRGQPARRWAGGGGCAPGRRLPQAINTSPSDPAPRWCAMAHPPRVGIAARQARRGGRADMRKLPLRGRGNETTSATDADRQISRRLRRMINWTMNSLCGVK
jgi:hypothetical protein